MSVITSAERHAARYERRVQKRQAKRLAYNAPYDNYETITDRNHLLQAAYMSRKGTGKKASVQRYMMNLMRNTSVSATKLEHYQDVRQGFIEFDLCERGKKRHIKAMHFNERVIQRCLCDYALVPVLKRPLVYDNGASMRGKGIHFALFRLRDMLRRYVRKYGTNGYILLVDFSGYFDNIQHAPIKELIQHSFNSDEIRWLVWQLVKAFGDKSLGIGSQVSQILAVAYANRVDHFIKEVYRIGMSARYMDDSYMICGDKNTLRKLLTDCKKMWADLGICINERKTQIVSIKHFTFMKVRFRITDTGKVLMLPCRASFTRMRRKLRKFAALIANGAMNMENVNTSYQSWYGYQNHFNAHSALRKMDKYYFTLFGEYPKHKRGACVYEL